MGSIFFCAQKIEKGMYHGGKNAGSQQRLSSHFAYRRLLWCDGGYHLIYVVKWVSLIDESSPRDALRVGGMSEARASYTSVLAAPMFLYHIPVCQTCISTKLGSLVILEQPLPSTDATRLLRQWIHNALLSYTD